MASERSAAFVTSRLGVKSQTVLPKEVRAALGVGPGDQIGYSIRDGRVIRTAKIATIAALDAQPLGALPAPAITRIARVLRRGFR